MLLTDRLANLAIFLALTIIAGCLFAYSHQHRPTLVSGLTISFASFLSLCGLSHFMLLLETVIPVYRVGIGIEILTALAAASTAFSLLRILFKGLKKTVCIQVVQLPVVNKDIDSDTASGQPA